MIVLLINLVFWQTVFSYSGSINGWSIGQVLMLQGFYCVFILFYYTFFVFADRISDRIMSGELDRVLTKPANEMVLMMLEGLWFSAVNLFNAGVYITLAISLGVSVSIFNFLLGILMALLAAIVVGLIMVSIGILTFWTGKTDSVMNILWDFVDDMKAYPSTIFPMAMQMVLVFVVPVAFMQTYPVLFTTGSIDLAFFSAAILTEVAMAMIWAGICFFMWKKGLKRYSSYGG